MENQSSSQPKNISFSTNEVNERLKKMARLPPPQIYRKQRIKPSQRDEKCPFSSFWPHHWAQYLFSRSLSMECRQVLEGQETHEFVQKVSKSVQKVSRVENEKHMNTVPLKAVQIVWIKSANNSSLMN